MSVIDKKSRQEIEKIATYIVILMCGVVITFILNQRISTILGAASYGDFAIASRMLWFLGVISVLGFNYFISIEFPRVAAHHHIKQGVGFLLSLLKILYPIVIFIVCFGVILLPLLFLSKYNKTLSVFENAHPFIYFVWAIPVLGLYKYCRSIVTSLGFGALAFVIDNLMLPILTFLLFMVLTLGHVHTVVLLFAPVVSTLLLVILLLVCLVIYFKHKHISVIGADHPDFVLDAKETVKVSMMLIVSGYLVSQNSTFILLMAEIFGKNEEMVGFVAACFSCLSTGLFCIFGSLPMILTPRFAKLLAQHDYKKPTQQLLNFIHLTCGALASLICIGVYIYAPQLLAGFGAEFKNNPIPIEMLRFSVLAIIPVFFIYYVDVVVQARKRNIPMAMIIAMIYCTTVILLAIPLTYYFYGFGAVATMVILNYVYYGIYTWVLYRKEKLKPIAF